MTNDEAYNLALPFDTDSEDFVRGVEVGMVWADLQRDGFGAFQVHASNAEMMIRLAEAMRLEHRAEIMDDRWIWVEFGAASP